MKFYNTRRSSSGEYWTTEWTADEVFSVNIITLVIVSCILAPLSAIASGILVLVTIHDLEDEGIVPSLFGALMSVLFILDIYHRFILNIILYIMFGNEWIKVFYDLNVAYLVTHIFLIFFGHMTYKSFRDKTTLFYICSAVFVITYFLSSAILTLKQL